jgi:hypothetical protein
MVPLLTNRRWRDLPTIAPSTELPQGNYPDIAAYRTVGKVPLTLKNVKLHVRNLRRGVPPCVCCQDILYRSLSTHPLHFYRWPSDWLAVRAGKSTAVLLPVRTSI